MNKKYDEKKWPKNMAKKNDKKYGEKNDKKIWRKQTTKIKRRILTSVFLETDQFMTTVRNVALDRLLPVDDVVFTVATSKMSQRTIDHLTYR